MSDQFLTSITDSLAQNFRSEVVRTANRRSILLKLLPIEQGAGKNSAWDVELDGAIGETFSDGDDVSNYGSDGVVPATLSPGLIRSNFRIGDEAIAAAQSSASPAGLVALVGRNFVNSLAKWASAVNVKLFSSASGIIGLDTALDDTNTYATINRTTSSNAGFRASVIDPGSLTDVTLADIRKDITVTIYKACGETPDIAVCSPEIFNKLGSLFTELRRYTQPVEQMTTGRGQILLDGSIGAIEFEGCVFFKDKDATANTIYYLNSRAVHLEWFPMQPNAMPIPNPSMESEVDDGYGSIPLGLYCKHLAATGAAEKFTIEGRLQLCVTRPNACAKRLNVKST